MAAPSGPPGIIKPSHELFGEILLRAGKPEQAMQRFKAALLRQPNRARSLLGVARAAAQMGDRQAATSAYTKFLDQWKQADEKLPELAEAKAFVQNRER
jgi:Tfp pilus assembly protein PilF